MTRPTSYLRKTGWMQRYALLPLRLALVFSIAVSAQTMAFAKMDITDMSLEDLMNVEITSVSKKNQRLSNTAAAAFVITREDIRRSGVRSIPEALRMAPGLHVAKVDGNVWAISARGFNNRLANKLLVLMDGRTLYDPLFSGVFWDIQDYPLDDIERIEVIRGPGGTIWGANAVNGVINIITKNAHDTQGGLLSAGAGSEEKWFGDARYGWQIGEKGAARLYVQTNERDETVKLDGNDHNDDYQKVQWGLRADWDGTEGHRFSLHGSVYDQSAGQTSYLPSENAPPSAGYRIIDTKDNEVDGGYALARWENTISEDSDLSVQFYYDRTDRSEAIGRLKRDTYDLEYNHRFRINASNELMWGLEYRLHRMKIEPTDLFNFSFVSPDEETALYSGFVQDEIALVEDLLTFTVGSKFEHNDYTGHEIQPSARLLWTPNERQSAWLAVSRAIRTPSKYENDVSVTYEVIPPFMPMMSALPVVVHGNNALEAEKALTLEAGYRRQFRDNLALDIAGHLNFYNDLQSLVRVNANDPTNLIIGNESEAVTYGFELAMEWKPLPWWKLKPAYTYLRMTFDIPADVISFAEADDNPEHVVSLRSEMDLPWNLSLDLWGRHVPGIEKVGAYTTMDARLSYQPTHYFELSLVGQNLFDSPHQEWSESQYFNESTRVEQGVYIEATWRF